MKNELARWTNGEFENKIILKGIVIIFIFSLIISIHLVNSTFSSFEYLWITAVVNVLVFLLFITLAFFSETFLHLPSIKYPEEVEIAPQGIQITAGKDKKIIPWSHLYGLINYSVKKYVGGRKYEESMEFRVFYYDEVGKLRWFCASEEIGKVIEDTWQSRRRGNFLK